MKDKDPDYGTIKNRFIKVSDWNKYHHYPPMGGLRHMIFTAKKNKNVEFLRAIKRIGRTVLIDEKKFFEWINAHGDAGYADYTHPGSPI